MNHSKTGIGIIGVGNISGIYLENLRNRDACEVVFCADIDGDRAKNVAAKQGVPGAGTPEDLLNDPSVNVVLNLTIPKAHFEVARAAVQAGKHVYNEKPLAVSFNEGKLLLELAAAKGVRVGCAPDTFFGSAHQACRMFVDSGQLGVITGAQAFMLGGGHESWHPNPEFYYKPGAGPMLDMGPYYLTALVNLLGPIKRGTGLTRITSPTRRITSEPRRGEIIEVETPTHIAASYEFESGPIAQMTMSFDVPVHALPHILIFGSEGTLNVPDPNGFRGIPTFCRRGSEIWDDIPTGEKYATNSRGVGLLDMVQAIQENRPHRASGALALHVLEAMLTPELSSKSGQEVTFQTTVDRPEPV